MEMILSEYLIIRTFNNNCFYLEHLKLKRELYATIVAILINVVVVHFVSIMLPRSETKCNSNFENLFIQK